MSNAAPITKADVAAILVGNCIPKGYAYTLVQISLYKRLLLCNMPAAERLKILENLDDSSNGCWLTSSMVEAIELMDDKGYELTSEARKLGPSKTLDVFAEHFPTFAVLNPSLIAALEMMPGCRRRIGAPA